LRLRPRARDGMNHCTPAWLVGLLHELPTDPSVAYAGESPVFGCNYIVCGECGAEVRHADHRSITSNYPPPAPTLEALYDSSDPASSPLLDAASLHRDSRAYFCRCNWASVDLGGMKSVGDVDAPWGCGGHPGPGEERPATEARRQGGAVAPPVAAPVRSAPALSVVRPAVPPAVTPPVAAPVPPAATGPKIRLTYGRGVNPEFSTASELRDSLLASYPAAAFFGAPVVELGGENLVSAWGWVVQLIRMRSDWWPAIGVALQHAVTDGGDLARTAFADLLADFRDSLVLLPWTAPVAASLPDVRARSSGTGWGAPDLRLESIVRDQTKYIDQVKATAAEAELLGYGNGGKVIAGPLTSETELRALLDQTAQAGQFPDGDKGPWSWLGFELRTNEAWVRSAFVQIASSIDAADEPQVFALLDWLSEEQDLWRLQPLLAGWDKRPPAWAKTAASHKPKGWKRTIRSSHWPEVQTLGDVVHQALARAETQQAMPPVMDLPPLFA